MLNQEILSVSIPALHPEDKVFMALEVMNDHHISHLPVIHDQKLLGTISEDILLNAGSDDQLLTDFQGAFMPTAVPGNHHILGTIQVVNEAQLSLVAVTGKDLDYLGAITVPELLRSAGKLLGAGEPGAIVMLEMEKVNFSFAEVSKLVETNDAQITQLNTYLDAATGLFYLTLRLNRQEISDIIATFQRYEYRVKYYLGEETYENELRTNYNHLMNYLSI